MRIAFLDDGQDREWVCAFLRKFGLNVPPLGKGFEGSCVASNDYCPAVQQKMVFSWRAKCLEPWLRSTEPTLIFLHWVQDTGWGGHQMMDEEVRRVRVVAPDAKIILTLEPTDHDTCCLPWDEQERYRKRQYPPEADGGLYIGNPDAISPWVGPVGAAASSGDSEVLMAVLMAFASSGENHMHTFAALIAAALHNKAEDQKQILDQCAELFRDTPKLTDPFFQQKWAALFAP